MISRRTFRDSAPRGSHQLHNPEQQRRVELIQRYSNLADVSKICRSDGVGAVPLERSDRSTHRIHNVRKRLGPEVVAQLVTDYQSGLATTALTPKYKIGKGTVLRILDDHGVVRRHQPLSQGQVEQAIELYRQGWSLAPVGQRLQPKRLTSRTMC